MPNQPSTNYHSFEVRSPLSSQVIIRKDPISGAMERFTCEACVKFIRERGQTHALDPIYFWGAGIFEYKTQVTPMGTKAFLNDAAFGNLIRSIPYSVKTEWKHFTGLNFPFNYVKGKKKNKPQ